MENSLPALQTINQLQGDMIYNKHMTNQNHTPIHHLLEEKKSHALHKEKEPYKSPLEDFENLEVQETVEYIPSEELGGFITHRPETIKPAEELSTIGVQATGSTQFPSLQNVIAPISDEKILVGLHAPITSSLRWLATFAVYLLKRAHIALKVIHGHAVRVFKK